MDTGIKANKQDRVMDLRAQMDVLGAEMVSVGKNAAEIRNQQVALMEKQEKVVVEYIGLLVDLGQAWPEVEREQAARLALLK